ncbi:MAG TPA: ADP-ribosylglycohydrolase family protein [Rhodothermales bacterium]|nr:ADP-ribosylglycohydrolase family protein [Rhodothermales bacterium]
MLTASSSRPQSVLAPRDIDRFRGCLLGGAVGDALGAPVEVLSPEEIREKYGPDGITDMVEAYGRVGAITDDTQMSLFTAEGMLRAGVRRKRIGHYDPVTVLHNAYMRWLYTQGERADNPEFDSVLNGWLITIEDLHARRAPGKSVMEALESGRVGTIDNPINQSKGAGGIMRSAPAGLAALPSGPFELGRDSAAITHGDPTAHLAAGCVSKIVGYLRDAWSLDRAIQETVRVLRLEQNHEETLHAIQYAQELVHAGIDHREALKQIGKGWVADEALGIALYCSLVAGDDFAKGVLLAVNHGGDADTTGAITGNILGTMLGAGAIPQHWLDKLELRDVITQLADDLHRGYEPADGWAKKYPPS